MGSPKSPSTSKPRFGSDGPGNRRPRDGRTLAPRRSPARARQPAEGLYPPIFLDVRHALEEALDLLGDTGDLNEEDLETARMLFWEVFARFGMGFEATTNGASLEGIVESTRLPPRLG